jgi:hypothetical protein
MIRCDSSQAKVFLQFHDMNVGWVFSNLSCDFFCFKIVTIPRCFVQFLMEVAEVATIG